jgi:hypothetical protein
MMTMSSMDTTLPVKELLNTNPAWIRDADNMGDLYALARHMKRYGQHAPILVDPSFRVIDGARRILAAEMLGWETIMAVCTGDFDAICYFMQAARDRESAGGNHAGVPHTWIEIAQLIWLLRDIHKVISIENANKTKRSGGPRKPNKHYHSNGAQVAVPKALGMSKNHVSLFGRAWTQFSDPSRTAQQRADMLAAWHEAEARGQPHSVLPFMMAALVDRTAKPSQKELLKAQRTSIPSAITSIRGSLLALPKHDEIDAGHDLEELERWHDAILPLITGLTKFRKALRDRINAEGDQEDDSDEE